MLEEKKIIGYLQENIVPAFGCTDPATPALAASIARSKVSGDLQAIQATVSSDIYKGAHDVTIPGTQYTGIAFALVLGAVSGNPQKKLMVLQDIDSNDVEKAEKLFSRVRMEVVPDGSKGEIFVDVKLTTTHGSARVIFDGRHDVPSEIFVNNTKEVIPQKSGAGGGYGESDVQAGLTIQRMLDFSVHVDIEKIYFLKEALDMNRTASIKGLDEQFGLGIGRTLHRLYAAENVSCIGKVKAFSTAAADLRMGGGESSCNVTLRQRESGCIAFFYSQSICGSS